MKSLADIGYSFQWNCLYSYTTLWS